jgi:hypothetical protein
MVGKIKGSQAKGVKQKRRERKLSGLNWQEALKQNGTKRGLGVFTFHS